MQSSKGTEIPAQPMALLSPITAPQTEDYTAGFIEAVNQNIQELNALIKSYNTAQGKPEKVKALQEIVKKHQEINDTYSGKDVEACPEYCVELHSKLFKETQQQAQSLGIRSMKDLLKIDPAPEKSLGTFSEILANMPPEKVSSLISRLLVKQDDVSVLLIDLYSADEDGYTEYQAFLAENAISVLGRGNSQNFTLTPNDGSPPYVLKVDNRMDMPNRAAAHLRANSLKATCTRVQSARSAVVLTPEGNQGARTVLVTEFCNGSDLLSHRESHNEEQFPERIKAALSIYGQMAGILKGIQEDGCAFPDMKNTNWLIDHESVLHLADTKSFIFTATGRGPHAKGTISCDEMLSAWCPSLLFSEHMIPPEYKQDGNDAGKMHSYMLGKNLYQYLTNKSDTALTAKGSFDYGTYPIFQAPEAAGLQALIEGLVHKLPKKRIGIEDALTKIGAISGLACARAPANAAAWKEEMVALRMLEERPEEGPSPGAP